jgi:Cdc6-like AAA superfamily ATPase
MEIKSMSSSATPESPDMMVRFLRSGEVFTPSAPIDNQALFVGRVNQLNRIMSAVSQRGQHAILFGERGVGKTSLANVLLKIMRGSQEHVESVIVNCDTEDTFEQLWYKIFAELENTQDLDFQPHQIAPEFIRVRLQRQIKGLVIGVRSLSMKWTGSDPILVQRICSQGKSWKGMNEC